MGDLKKCLHHRLIPTKLKVILPSGHSSSFGRHAASTVYYRHQHSSCRLVDEHFLFAHCPQLSQLAASFSAQFMLDANLQTTTNKFPYYQKVSSGHNSHLKFGVVCEQHGRHLAFRLDSSYCAIYRSSTLFAPSQTHLLAFCLRCMHCSSMLT